MPDFQIINKDLLTSVDRAADSFLVYDSSAQALKRTTINYALDLASHPVGIDDSQTLTNKTLTAPNISAPVLSGTISGTYTIGGTVTFPSSVATLTGIQTLTNKTLTSPTLTSPTITNPTITVDTLSEFTAGNGIVLDGFAVKDSKIVTANSVVETNITDGAITTAKIFDDSVNDSKLDYPRWWHEIGRTTLSVAGDTITVTGLPARGYIRIIARLIASGSIRGGIRFNNDSANNYSYRTSTNGAADATATSQSSVLITATGSTDKEFTCQIYNSSTQEKNFFFNDTESAAGAGTAPGRIEGVGRWASNTQVSRVDFINDQAGDFAIGSEVIVLGHD